MDPDEITRRANTERDKIKKTKNRLPSKPFQLKINPSQSWLRFKKQWGMGRRFESVTGFFFIFGCLFLYIYLTDEEPWALYATIALWSLLLFTFLFFIIRKLLQNPKN